MSHIVLLTTSTKPLQICSMKQRFRRALTENKSLQIPLHKILAHVCWQREKSKSKICFCLRSFSAAPSTVESLTLMMTVWRPRTSKTSYSCSFQSCLCPVPLLRLLMVTNSSRNLALIWMSLQDWPDSLHFKGHINGFTQLTPLPLWRRKRCTHRETELISVLLSRELPKTLIVTAKDPNFNI